MAAIPESTLPGHRHLHERVVAALDLCQESRDLDFKESAPWGDLKWRIARSALGMANLRDGGVIVVGVSERDGEWSLVGIADAHFASYNEDDLNDFVNRYASPPMRIELVRVLHGAKKYLAVRCPEFEFTPVICKRDGPKDSKLTAGAVYVRPIGKPETTRVRDASQLEDLLELSAEKRAVRMLTNARRLGLEVPGAADPMDAELEGL